MNAALGLKGHHSDLKPQPALHNHQSLFPATLDEHNADATRRYKNSAKERSHHWQNAEGLGFNYFGYRDMNAALVSRVSGII